MIQTMILATCHGISAALTQLPQNGHLWTYNITGQAGGEDPYITRTLFPRVAGIRPMLHQIHRPDDDMWCHNHPWKWAYSLILSGGYTEGREQPRGALELIDYRPGDINRIQADTFHRITHVLPDTWTLLFVGPSVQDWGFRVEGKFVPAPEYFQRLNLMFSEHPRS
jgi:hypothetical protein